MPDSENIEVLFKSFMDGTINEIDYAILMNLIADKKNETVIKKIMARYNSESPELNDNN